MLTSKEQALLRPHIILDGHVVRDDHATIYGLAFRHHFGYNEFRWYRTASCRLSISDWGRGLHRPRPYFFMTHACFARAITVRGAPSRATRRRGPSWGGVRVGSEGGETLMRSPVGGNPSTCGVKSGITSRLHNRGHREGTVAYV